MAWADGARRAHNFCVAAVLENIHHHRNRTFSYPLASPVPMEMFANFYMERQGEYYGFHPADGLRIMISYAVIDSLAVPEFVVCGYCLQSENDGQAVATAAFPVSPSESPRYFAANMDESIIVGYYTSAEVLS